jgi:hypothetical protein
MSKRQSKRSKQDPEEKDEKEEEVNDQHENERSFPAQGAPGDALSSSSLTSSTPTPASISKLHPVLGYFLQNEAESWEIKFDHEIAQVFEEKTDFVCEGVIHEEISLRLRPNGTTRKEELDCGTLCEPNIELLLQHATPSSFGLGDQTLYDENIRKGKELLPSDLATINFDSFPSKIEDILFPTAPAGLKFVFSKIAFYEPGGHFESHRDTVRSHDHQGTLLVEIKSQHTGGDLVLNHHGVETRWSLATDPQTRNPYRHVNHWIAFYTDIEHRVESVHTGIRAVLQFDILLVSLNKGKKPKKSSKKKITKRKKNDNFFTNCRYFSSSISPNFISQLQELLQKYFSDTSNENLAISLPLFYLYTDKILLPQRLKYKDQQIFELLLSIGYCIQLRPIIIEAITPYRRSEENDEEIASWLKPSYEILPIPPISGQQEGFILQSSESTSMAIASSSSSSSSSLPSSSSSSLSHQIISTKIPSRPSKITYIATGYEQLIELDSNFHTGNYSSPPEYKYFSVVFVVMTRRCLEPSSTPSVPSCPLPASSQKKRKLTIPRRG